ncbi:MAG: nucleotidyltransferase family protein [Betaproteobacteria bacterium]|nr:MAG: nucleotidyltransferase family protein [Betaproteobacteria bacterium]
MDAFELLVEAHRPAMKAVLAKLVQLLEAHNVRYVIGGANALSLYVRPRMTVDVDAFVDPTRKADIDKLLAAEFEVVKIGGFHSKFKHADVEIDILYAGASAEDFALANARDAVILGTKLKAPSPEALLWLYLVSDQEQNFVDALNLLRSNPGLDRGLVRRQLQRHQPDLLPKLEKMLHTAQQAVPSYDESRAKR